MNTTLVLLAVGFVAYLVASVFQWRRLTRGEPKRDSRDRE
jgi:hypothetical protein